jgi:putative two-component system response regulator
MAEKQPDERTERFLVVDDEEPICRLIVRLLAMQGYDADYVMDVAAARVAVETGTYCLVLTDLNMPGDSGLELVRELAGRKPHVGCLMVTGEGSVDIGKTVLHAGAYGYISKPVDPDSLLIAIVNALERQRLELGELEHRQRLEETVADRTRDLWQTNRRLEKAMADVVTSQEETIERLVIAAEFRDDETGQHIQRMSRYAEIVALAISGDTIWSANVRLASVMHDVGKIAIPDDILRKPGRLSAREWRVMQTHAEIGSRILSGSDSELLQNASEIALTHHERWDGTGYPQGLRGEEIPLVGRIAAVADVFDALTSDRVYRRRYSIPDALQMMRDGRGSQLAPDALDALFSSIADIITVYESHFGYHGVDWTRSWPEAGRVIVQERVTLSS